MALQMLPQLVRLLDELRYEPTGKRIRALVDGDPVVDTTGALVVWEPRRVVPTYAVPEADVRGELVPAPAVDVPQKPGHPVVGLTVAPASGNRVQPISSTALPCSRRSSNAPVASATSVQLPRQETCGSSRPSATAPASQARSGPTFRQSSR